jgi:hypothetical protein
MELDYDQYLKDMHHAYVGRVATIVGGHSQAGRTGRVKSLLNDLSGLKAVIAFFGPHEPHEVIVRLDLIRLEPLPG